MKTRNHKTSRGCTAALLVAALAANAMAQERTAQPERSAEIVQTSEISVLRNARDALMVASDFAAALAPAEEVVAQSQAASDSAYRVDLSMLGRIQAELERFDDAETTYLTVIELIVEDDGENAMTLINPYQGLGRNYLNERRFDEAITVLEAARGISQRNTGLFNVEQTALIDDMTMAQLGKGNTREAQDLQLERLDNAVRRFGADDPRLIPYHNHLGQYFDNSRLRVSARAQYEKVLGIQESQVGPQAAQLLEPLRKLVQIELMLGDDDVAKQRLLATLHNNPNLDAAERGLSLALLGDWAIVNDDFGQASDYYQQAYDALDSVDGIDVEEMFSQPATIDFIPPLNSVDKGARRDPWTWGSIELRFDLSPDGRAFDVQTVQLNPPGRIETRYVQRLRETHFRPKLVAGTPVATANVQFTEFFRYYVRD